jgi:hypothetical protein
MSLSVGVGGAYKPMAKLAVGVSGANKICPEGWIGVGGAWKRFLGISLSLNRTTVHGSNEGSGNVNAQTNTVTVTATGGSGNYSYFWAYRSGDTDPTLVNYTPASTAAWGMTLYVPPDQSRAALWGCHVVDNVTGETADTEDVAVAIDLYFG